MFHSLPPGQSQVWNEAESRPILRNYQKRSPPSLPKCSRRRGRVEKWKKVFISSAVLPILGPESSYIPPVPSCFSLRLKNSPPTQWHLIGQMHATEKKKGEKTEEERIQKYCSSKTADRNGRIWRSLLCVGSSYSSHYSSLGIKRTF